MRSIEQTRLLDYERDNDYYEEYYADYPSDYSSEDCDDASDDMSTFDVIEEFPNTVREILMNVDISEWDDERLKTDVRYGQSLISDALFILDSQERDRNSFPLNRAKIIYRAIFNTRRVIRNSFSHIEHELRRMELRHIKLLHQDRVLSELESQIRQQGFDEEYEYNDVQMLKMNDRIGR